MLNDIKKASPTSLEGDAVSETTPQLSATGKPAQDFIGDVPNAKVNITSENKKGIVKNLQVLTKICQEDDVSATDFLNKLREALSIGEKAGTSYLRQDMEDGRHSLRIADHSINAKNNNNGKDKIIQHGKTLPIILYILTN